MQNLLIARCTFSSPSFETALTCSRAALLGLGKALDLGMLQVVCDNTSGPFCVTPKEMKAPRADAKQQSTACMVTV